MMFGNNVMKFMGVDLDENEDETVRDLVAKGKLDPQAGVLAGGLLGGLDEPVGVPVDPGKDFGSYMANQGGFKGFFGAIADPRVARAFLSDDYGEYKQKKALYDVEKDAFAAKYKSQMLSSMLDGVDMKNLTLPDLAVLDEIGMGDYANDMFSAQNAEVGADHAIAEAVGVPYAQWVKRSPEQKRIDRYQHGGDAYQSAVLGSQGKAPEQLQSAKSAEQFGSAEGTQYGQDRQAITSIRGTVQAADQSLEALGGIKGLLSNPDNNDLTGWQRSIRDVIRANTREDGTLDAEMATGVVDLISKATFGALSQSELDLLKGGLMDPTKSVEYNLGTIDKAMERIRNDKDVAVGSAQSAARRYQGWDGQDDYDRIMEDDWLYQNIGEGSRIQSIPAFGGNEEYTFQQYVEDTMAEVGPFGKKPSRDELVVGFAQVRKEAEEAYNEMVRMEKENSATAKQVRAELSRPFPTVAQ